MVSKGAQLGIEFRIEPVRRLDCSFEVVQDQGLGRAAKVDKGVLQAGQKSVGGLPIDGLAVALARVRQDDAEDMGPVSSAIGAESKAGCRSSQTV